ncbi:serine/arginine repetitive matrix protein 2-like [Amphibalanus amphitrite]|uniref:serine/arginine repetitive matrix protein 2-like n=1 Tax=Amphibalanus amphitrite TaxID=1232801 RepID=UPI001C90083C|nr:serine/arginine repetitive matrix protein 2-like [Amphibalanus amphitrite]
MFRLKRQQQAPVLPLPVRRLWTVGASGSVSLSSYILVGYCINQVAGAGTLVSVIIASIMAAITGVAYVELTQRTRVTGSPYSFCYTYLGELPAFFVGWAVVGECTVGTAVMGKAITYYSDFLTDGRLNTSLYNCCQLAGEVDIRLWNFFDPIAMSAVIIVGVVCAINSSVACKINQGLLLVNFVTVVVTIIFNSTEGSTDSWNPPGGNGSIFFPEDFGALGVFRASAIYMHVFLTLATTATLATQHRGAKHSSAISMVVTTLVAIIAISKTVSVSLLEPYDKLKPFTPVASYMKNVTEHNYQWVANVNCLGAIVASTAGILSMLVLSANTLEQMVSDGLLWSKLAARRPAISPATTTLITTVVAAIGAALQDYEGLILSLSSGTFLVFQALLIAVMVSRSHESKETALLIVLKFTWLLYFFVSPALVMVTRHLGEKVAQSAVQGLLSGLVMLFLQLAINWKHLGVKVVVVQVGTSVVMGFSSFLMYQLDDFAWYRLFIWTFIGLLIYTLYGYRKSHLGRGIVDLVVVPEDDCVRSLEEGLDNAGFQDELAEFGIGWRRRTHRSIGGHSYASARSRHKESFHSAREEDLRRQSFRSVRDDDERKASFKSFSESYRSSRQPSLVAYSISSGEPSAGPRGDQPDGRRASRGPRHPGGARDSFRSVQSYTSKASFRSVRSDDGWRSSIGGASSGRRSRLASDSWRSASSGDSRRSSSRRRRRVSPPRHATKPDARAVPAERSGSPVTSRKATAADLTRTPPPTRRTATAERARTPPPTPSGRGQVEILINPRRLCEEMYPTSAAPPRTSTAPADLFLSGESHDDGGNPREAADSISPINHTKDGIEKRHESRVGDMEYTSSDSTSSESDNDAERLRYSEADIDAASITSNCGSKRPSSSGSSSDRARASLPAPNPGASTIQRLPDLGLGDLAPVPRGKRSLSMSDISYDDESDSAPAMRSDRRRGQPKVKQVPAITTKEEQYISGRSSESSDEVPRIHSDPMGANHAAARGQTSPKIKAALTSDLNLSPKLTGDSHNSQVKRTKPHLERYTSSASSSTEDDDEQRRSAPVPSLLYGQPRKSSDHAIQAVSAPTYRDAILLDLEGQVRDSRFPEEHHSPTLSGGRKSEAKLPDLPAIGKGLTKSDTSSSTGSVSSEDIKDDGIMDSQVGNNSPSSHGTDEGTSSEENEADDVAPRSDLGRRSSYTATGDEAGYRSGEESSEFEEEEVQLSHSDPSVGSNSQSSQAELHDQGQSSAKSSINASERGLDTSSDSEVDSRPARPVSVAAALADGPPSPSPEDQQDMRPVVRRQMRLPHVPAEARWLARTPTPPGLLSALGVSDGPRLALERSSSLPSLSSSTGDDGSRSERDSPPPQQRSGLDSGGSHGGLGPKRAQSLPDVSDSGSDDSRAPGSELDHDSSSDDEQVAVPHGRAQPPPARQRSSSSGSDGTSSDGGSPVPLRRRPPLDTRPSPDRTVSLKEAPPPPRNPAARLGSLPPLNPEYRAIYRPAEQTSLPQGAGR